MERQPAGEELAADELVERVMPTDVLTQSDDPAAGFEEPSSVESTRRLEECLCLAELCRQADDHIATDDGNALRDRIAADGDLVERRLAADPA